MITIYWIVKILSWVGLLFSAFAVIRPACMLDLLLRTVQWKLRMFGLEGDIRPAANALTVTRIWSGVMALVFGGLVYIFTCVITMAYILQ